MSNGALHEVHLFREPDSHGLARLREFLPDLKLKTNCDPANTPEGSICYEYPRGREYEFERAATIEGIKWQWGGGGANWVACFALGDYLYGVADSPALGIWDISIHSAPVSTATLILAHVPTCIYVYGSIAFVGCLDGALLVVDVDDPAAPEVTATVLNPGQNWDHIYCVAGEIYLSGPNSSGIGIFEVKGRSAPKELSIFNSPGGGSSQAVVEGRRVFFGDAVGGTLRSYRVGGFRCTKIATGSLTADQVFSEEYRGRHLYLKGSAIVRELTVLGVRGELGTTYRITLGPKSIFWGTGSPEGVQAAPIGSLFLSDGSAADVLYVKETGTGDTGWIGK